MTTSLRSKLLWLHTWAGIITGGAMLLFALTGAVLVLRPYIDPIIDAPLHQRQSCSARLSFDRIAQIAAVANPVSKPKKVNFIPGERGSIDVSFDNNDHVYVDQCSGRVLQIRNEYAGFTGTLDWLHRFRFMAGGRPVAGWFNSAILLFLVIGGTILWWPRTRATLKAGLRFNFRLPGIARTLSLHRFLGIYSAIWLLLLTLTGMPISFGWAKAMLGWPTNSSVESPKPPKIPPRQGKPASVEALQARALRLIPSAEWVSIDIPKEASKPVRVEYMATDAPHEEAKSYLYLDPVTGDLIKQYDYRRDIPAGRRAYLYTVALHQGLTGGLLLQLLLALACVSVPVQVYSGLSSYIRKSFRRKASRGLQLRLVERRKEANGVISLEFEEAGGKALPAFSAGSHIDLRLAPGLVRQYSLCNCPTERHRYVIAVQLAEPSRGGSALIHEQLEIGTIVSAGAPRNHFPLAHAAPHSVLIAGGIGITPILCMAERLATTKGSFELHYCVRNRGSAAFHDRIFKGPMAGHSHLHSSEQGDRLDVAALIGAVPRGSHIYVCGPNRLNEAVEAAAATAGWDPALIHREYFSAPAVDSSRDSPFDVRIASTGALLHVPADRSIVDVLTEAGIELPTSCSEGVCGTCITRVLEGEIVHRDLILTPEQRARQDQLTPCCSRASSKLLVLDL